MAPLNPTPPETRDPNFLGYSRPIETPHFQSATAEAVKGTGQLLAGAITSADEVMKSYIATTERRGLEEIRDREVGNLTAAESYTRLATIAPLNITPQSANGGETPPELKNVGTTLNRFANARANGKISETHMWAEADTFLKDLRDRVPEGYRPYIDEQAKSILGAIPANARLQSLIGDINAAMGAKNSEVNELRRAFEQAAKDGETSAPTMAEHYIGTGDLKGGWQWIADTNFRTARNKKVQQDTEYSKMTRDQRYTTADQQFRDENTGWVHSSLQNFLTVIQQKIPYDAVDAAGNPTWSEQKQQLIATQMLAQKDQLKALLWQKAREKDKNGYSYATLAPDQATINKTVDDMVAPYTWAGERIMSKDTGTATLSSRLNDAARNGTTAAIYKNFPITLALRTMKDNLGDQGFALWWGQVQSKFVSDNKALFDTQLLDTFTRNVNNPKSLSETFDEAKKMGVQFPQHYKGLVDMITGPQGLLSDQPSEKKLGIAASIANPNNTDLLFKIKEGYKDPDGIWHEGKEDIWTAITSPKVANEMAKVANETGNGWLLKNYADAMSTTFRTDIFQKDLARLKSVVDSDGFKLKWTADEKNGVYRWDVESKVPSDENRSKFLGRAGYRGDTNPALTEAKKVVEHLNQGVRGLVNVAKAAGANPNEAVLGLFQDSGYDLTKTGGDIPSKMLDAIKYNGLKPKKDKLEELAQ